MNKAFFSIFTLYDGTRHHPYVHNHLPFLPLWPQKARRVQSPILLLDLHSSFRALCILLPYLVDPSNALLNLEWQPLLLQSLSTVRERRLGQRCPFAPGKNVELVGRASWLSRTHTQRERSSILEKKLKKGSHTEIGHGFFEISKVDVGC